MRSVLQKCAVACFPIMLCTAIVSVNTVLAKTCPPPVTSTIPSYSNTYYPGQQVTVIAGSTSVTIGAATYGTTPISAGGSVLINARSGHLNLTVYTNGGNGSSNFDGGAGNFIPAGIVSRKQGNGGIGQYNFSDASAGIYFVKAFDGAGYRKGTLVIHN